MVLENITNVYIFFIQRCNDYQVRRKHLKSDTGKHVKDNAYDGSLKWALLPCLEESMALLAHPVPLSLLIDNNSTADEQLKERNEMEYKRGPALI